MAGLLDLMELVGQKTFFKRLDEISYEINHNPSHPWHAVTDPEGKLDVIRSEMSSLRANPSYNAYSLSPINSMTYDSS